jgi:hypothetical protein
MVRKPMMTVMIWEGVPPKPLKRMAEVTMVALVK